MPLQPRQSSVNEWKVEVGHIFQLISCLCHVKQETFVRPWSAECLVRVRFLQEVRWASESGNKHLIYDV